MGLDISVAVLALGVLLLDLWMPVENRSKLAYVIAAALAGILIGSFIWSPYTIRVLVDGELKHFVQLTGGDLFVMDDLALFFWRPSPLLILMAVLAAPHLWKAIKFDPNAPENVAYYSVAPAKRFEYAVYYIVLAAFLAIMSFDVHEMLERMPRVRSL